MKGRPRSAARDDDVVLAVAAGQSASEIGRRFGLSRSRISRLIQKLRVMGRITEVAPEPQGEEAPQLFETRYAEWIPIPICARDVSTRQQIYGPKPRHHYEGGYSMIRGIH